MKRLSETGHGASEFFMRVLIDCSRIRSGGGMQGALSLIHNAAETRGHEWHLALSHEVAGQLPDEIVRRCAGITLPMYKALPVNKLLGPFHMSSVEKRLKPDVVYSYGGPVYWRSAAPHVVGFAQGYLIYPEIDTYQWFSFTGKLRKFVTMTAARRSFLQADCLIVETPLVKKRVSEVLGFPSQRIFVVPNTYSPLFEAGLRKEPELPKSNAFSIFVPSDYLPHKNLGLIVQVAAELVKKRQHDFEFVFTLPPGSKGWQTIRSNAEKAGVEEHLRTVGKIPHADLAKYYQAADAVFLPTLLECSTAVYPESFLARVPLMTSRTDFAQELCGDAALYFDPYSPQDAAEAVFKVIMDSSLRDCLTGAGCSQLEKTYVTPDEKWKLQLDCIRKAADMGCRKRRSR